MKTSGEPDDAARGVRARDRLFSFFRKLVHFFRIPLTVVLPSFIPGSMAQTSAVFAPHTCAHSITLSSTSILAQIALLQMRNDYSRIPQTRVSGTSGYS